MKLILTTFFFLPLLLACSQNTQKVSNPEILPESAELKYKTASDVGEFAESFMGYCVLNMPRIEKVSAISRVNKWEALNEDMLSALGPVEPGIDMLGWIIQGEQNPMFIATTDGIIDSERHRNCTIMSKVSDADVLSEKIVGIVGANATPRTSEIESGQRYRVWGYENLGQKFRLIITDSPEFAPGVITISTNFVSEPI
jgi:hypothetical protein